MDRERPRSLQSSRGTYCFLFCECVFCAVPTRRRNQDAGKSVSEETLLTSARIWLQNQIPMAFQGADEMVGARREAGAHAAVAAVGDQAAAVAAGGSTTVGPEDREARGAGEKRCARL